ncbi:APC family permease [Actinomadura rupiterrae]|uniref:APC family permease n=1 Tax=Actinomadura rupiterrae TaxID=559627 RepID=UPI0020A5D336|nr:APC family permease [Actinomadura rupiterrae]MCP2341856.1 amino acid transporter [Actinomadura rupiterrae]
MAISDVASPLSAPADRPGRRIGVPGIVFFVVAASAPLTVAAGGMPTSFAVSRTLGIPALYVVLGVLLIVFTGGYAAMSRSIANAGAFYAYVTHGLGRVAGVATAFIALLSYNTMQVGLYGIFGFTTADLLKSRLGWDLPWWTVALAGVAVVAVLGFRRIDLNARVLGVLLAVEFLTVLVFDLAQFADAPDGVTAQPLGWDAVQTGATGAAMVAAMASFMGFEAAALYSEECRDPRRTVARATYIAVAVIALFYAFTAWAITIGAGPRHIVERSGKEGPGMIWSLAAEHLNRSFSDLAQLFLVTSLFAALLSFHNAVARYFYSLGRDGVLPSPLARTHPKHSSPHVGSAAQTVLAIAVVVVFAASGKDPVLTLFNWFTNLGALGVMLLLALTSAAVVAYFLKDARGENLWNRLIAPVLAALGLAALFVVCLRNFDALLGADKNSPLVWILPGTIFAVAAAGVAFALVLRTVRPTSYERIGRG